MDNKEIGKETTYLFVTEMLRWGDAEDHHYIIGSYSKLEYAVKAGLAEREFRGGKYEPQVFMSEIDGDTLKLLCSNADQAKKLL